MGKDGKPAHDCHCGQLPCNSIPRMLFKEDFATVKQGARQKGVLVGKKELSALASAIENSFADKVDEEDEDVMHSSFCSSEDEAAVFHDEEVASIEQEDNVQIVIQGGLKILLIYVPLRPLIYTANRSCWGKELTDEQKQMVHLQSIVTKTYCDCKFYRCWHNLLGR